jgi:aerobic-type carbon monoxide dehydrogenase small subunit (CoxS/CutS family)
MNETFEFKLNQKPVRWSGDGERMLLWVLRVDLGLTGAKYGCGKGICGACTVLVDKKAFRSCQVPLKEIHGKEVITIEGLARNGQLHPLQKAFIEKGALQCGFCTPGMILNAYRLLLEKPVPTEKDILRGMDDVLCRCGSHQRIVEAIQSVAGELRSIR